MAMLSRESSRLNLLGLSRFCLRRLSVSTELGVREFLKSVGKGVDSHAEKVEKEVGGMQGLLLMKCEGFKKISIPCKQRKLILRYTEKYRQGLWMPKQIKSTTPTS